jgi:hypothetical protein
MLVIGLGMHVYVLHLMLPFLRAATVTVYMSVHVSIATSLHQSFPWLHPVQA